MSDLISRQAAINAVIGHAIWLQETFHETCNVVGAVDAIRDIPSAQPDWDEMLVICDNCGHAIHVKRLRGGNDGT